MGIGAEILVILLLTLANGFFAGAEIAMLATRKGRLAERAERGSRGARLALWLRAQPERFLATVQVGITVIGATAAAFGGASVAQKLAEPLIRLGLSQSHARDLALAAVIAFVSFASIVLGELIPKSLALRHAEGFTIFAAPILRAIAWLARPIVWFLTASSNLVLRAFGDQTSFGESRLSPEELQQLVEEAALAGTVDRDASELASRALDLVDLRVEAIQIPRHEIVFVRRAQLRDDLLDALARAPHERYPVVENHPDDTVGYVVVRDVAAALARNASDFAPRIRPITFVPEGRRAIDLLREMQRDGSHLALVVDEQGVVTGLVSLEDLLEELVGDILSEGETATRLIERSPDGTALVRGKAGIHEVNRALSLDLPEGPGYATIAGLVVTTAGSIPEPGRTVEVEGTRLEVVDASARRVLAVRVHPRPRTPV